MVSKREFSSKNLIAQTFHVLEYEIFMLYDLKVSFQLPEHKSFRP
jgi:hypothetical protein